MAKRRVTKRQRQQIKSGLLRIGLVLAGIIIGGLTVFMINRNDEPPRTLVWAVDEQVIIPDDLEQFLRTQDNCKDYRSRAGIQGVGLWGVIQVEQAKFAKVAYGCSLELINYAMAVKVGATWRLLPPEDYFAGSVGSLPHCKQLEKHKIPGEIEPFCSNSEGEAETNEL